MMNKRIFTAALAITISHFVLTTMIGHFIAVHIGTEMGTVVANSLIEASDNSYNKSETNANRIYQNMKSKSDGILESWRIPRLLISLPVKPLMKSLLTKIRNDQSEKVIAKEISKDQFRARARTVEYVANMLNSFSFGLLVYIMVSIFNHTKGKHDHAMHPIA